MRKFIAKGKEQPLVLLLGSMLLLQIILIAVCNVGQIDEHIDSDNAKLFMHIMEMWENKTLNIPDWLYPSTVEIDCGSLLALPLYAITRNIFLAFGMANVLFLLLFVWVIFFLFRGQSKTYPLAVCNMICVPYAFGMLDYFNMLFFAGSQYIIKVLVPILLVALLQYGEQPKKRSGVLWGVVALYGILLFVTSLSSGVYVLMVGVFPVFCVYALYKLLKYEKIPLCAFGVAAVSVVTGVMGLWANQRIMEGAHGNGMTLCTIYDIAENISKCFWGIFELFGGVVYSAETLVLSMEGILVMLKMCFVIMLLVCAVVAVTQIIKKKAGLRTVLLFSLFGWNVFVLCITNSTYGAATFEYRYHLVGMIPLICMAGELLVDKLEDSKPIQYGVFSAAGVILLLVLNICSFRNFWKAEDPNVVLKEVTAYCEELDVEYIYFYNKSADPEICRLFGSKDRTWLCMTPDGRLWVYDYYSTYLPEGLQTQNAVVVVDQAYYDVGEAFQVSGHDMVKLTSIDNMDLYYFK